MKAVLNVRPALDIGHEFGEDQVQERKEPEKHGSIYGFCGCL